MRYLWIVCCFPLTLICILLIWGLSFFTPPQTPLQEVVYIDKWTHLVMYGGTVGVFWVEYLRAKWRGRLQLTARWLWVVAVVAPVLLGGLIELLQAYCTAGQRSGEWLDWLADSLGVMLASLAGWGVGRYKERLNS